MKKQLLLLLIVFFAWSGSADFSVTNVGVLTPVPDNCGFVVDGTTNGQIRGTLWNDPPGTFGYDFYVRAGQYYPFRFREVTLPTDTIGPTGLTFDDSRSCGYSRGMGLEECGNYDSEEIPPNVGFLAGWQDNNFVGQIDIRLRKDGESGPWWTVSAGAGEFILGEVGNCRLAESPTLTYITVVGDLVEPEPEPARTVRTRGPGKP